MDQLDSKKFQIKNLDEMMNYSSPHSFYKSEKYCEDRARVDLSITYIIVDNFSRN
ncbi:MAG: hypothetical protein HY831_01980 [Candidatus Aenigmarchaeota archaeon]|nr:hypothetical protein [Candidatus Aenigmarchaeota archaeon]